MTNFLISFGLFIIVFQPILQYKQPSKMSNWADLPHFIVCEIICRLSFFDDIFIVGAVCNCKSWKSVVNSFEKPPPLPPKGPWIMLSEEREQGNKESKTRSLFNLLDTKTYYFKLPELVGRKCLGTSFGWLLTIGADFQINLFHPLSKHLIRLPPQPTFCRQYTPEVEPEHLRNIFVRKCVLSRSPWNSVTNEYDRDCIIMAIYGEIRTLAFTRPGYKAWIDIESPSRAYDDIAYYKGNFYAVDAHGEVFACQIDDNQKVVAKAVAPRPKGTRDLIKKYTVESAGDLLLVLRVRGGHYYSIEDYPNYEEDEFHNVDLEDDIEDEDAPENESEEEVEEEEKINDNSYVTVGFTVLKLKRFTQAGSKYKYKYVKVDNLGDRALFVGDNSSVSLSASSLNGCKANCIYFTDDNIELYEETLNGGGYDMGVFCMKDGTFYKHYPESFSYYSTPLWSI